MSEVQTSSYDALIAAATRQTVDVPLSTGAAVGMRGLTIIEFLQTIREYPKVRDVLLHAIAAGDDIKDDTMLASILETFIDSGPEAVATLIAKAMGLNDAAARNAVLGLGDEDFFALLDRALELTMPRGVGDFFGRAGAVAARLGLVVSQPSAEAA